MKFTTTALEGVLLVDIERHTDERGFFARTWCAREFAAAGIDTPLVQTSVSWNARRGTLRGMHFQRPPSREGKLVRCTRGRMLDVLVDLRPESATFLKHVRVELEAETYRAVYVPPGVAHGFQTLVDDTEVLYCMTDYHAPELAAGVRWNDPAFGIEWPITPPIMNARDASYPDFQGAA
ncbi:MAG TPA: dTDP-4-dehydrorhamnose 3,5-epimerase [Steroidobacteraceae bacterium]